MVKTLTLDKNVARNTATFHMRGPLGIIFSDTRKFTNLTQQIEFLDLLYGDKKLQKIKP